MKTLELYQKLNISENDYIEITHRLGREPNELETYLFSAMWSEHCGYRHSKKYLSLFPKSGGLLTDENAGGIQIGNHVIVFKVESHNHPSAVEPYQGAATGIGGIIRDVLAVGARPIALLDSLKFGKLSDSLTKHLFEGVVKGISVYGNSIGVPTVAGEVSFDETYTDSPLVNVMAVGIVRRDKIKLSKAEPGNVIILAGSHTGRDGIHGASFASKELSEDSKADRPSVQIGDPFIKKVLIEATLEVLNIEEVVSCQDCGAAGLLSSTSEMAYKGDCGITLDLDKVHLREADMHPWEIMLSESQERMVFIVSPKGVGKVLNVCKKYDMPASIIGRTTTHKNYTLLWNGEELASLQPEALGDAPIKQMSDTRPEYISILQSIQVNQTTPIPEAVMRIISDPNFASKKWVFRQYDHTVGTRTSIRPGDGGAAGLWIYEEGTFIGLTIDSNGRQVFLDPYNGSRNTVWEAARNLISCGFKPAGITDCLNYGNPEKEDIAFQFISSVKGIADGCNDLNIPVVSGNVSFYNESPDRRVYPTPAIGMLGIATTAEHLIRNAFKEGDTLILLGKEIDELSPTGGSLYEKVFYDFLGGPIDNVDAILELQLMNTIFNLRDRQLLTGCVDVSEGGLLGAVFEGLLRGNTGFKGNLIFIDNHEKALFGEINGRYVISTRKLKELEEFLANENITYKILGKCQGTTFEFNDYIFETSTLFDLYKTSLSEEMQS